MEIQHKKGIQGEFFIEEESKKIANLEYEQKDGKLVITHTKVTKDKEGQGIGKSLVVAAVDFARKEKLQVKPVCPFAKAIIKGDEKLQDVIA